MSNREINLYGNRVTTKDRFELYSAKSEIEGFEYCIKIFQIEYIIEQEKPIYKKLIEMRKEEKYQKQQFIKYIKIFTCLLPVKDSYKQNKSFCDNLTIVYILL